MWKNLLKLILGTVVQDLLTEAQKKAQKELK